MDKQLTTLTITNALEKLEKKEFSSVELTNAYLERIEKLDPVLNAFITVTKKRGIAAGFRCG